MFQAYHGVTGAQHQNEFQYFECARLQNDLAQRLRRSR